MQLLRAAEHQLDIEKATPQLPHPHQPTHSKWGSALNTFCALGESQRHLEARTLGLASAKTPHRAPVPPAATAPRTLLFSCSFRIPSPNKGYCSALCGSPPTCSLDLLLQGRSFHRPQAGCHTCTAPSPPLRAKWPRSRSSQATCSPLHGPQPRTPPGRTSARCPQALSPGSRPSKVMPLLPLDIGLLRAYWPGSHSHSGRLPAAEASQG